jgi:DNA-binding NtrC family response regulator
VVAVELPPLRSRRDDIPFLADHFIQRLGRKYNWPHLGLAPDAVKWLSSQDWPGNVRQLQNVLARAAILSRGRTILAEDFGPTTPPTAPATEACSNGPMSLKDLLAETERRAIVLALEQTGWNRTKASQLLGISRRQLFDKIRQYDLQK